jgi:hypothetical protein
MHKGLVVYRILSVIVNLISALMAFNLIAMIPMVLHNPAALLICAIMLCVVLYAWHAHRFFVLVIMKNQPSTHKHRDWIRVNSIVSLIFGGLIILSSIGMLLDPKPLVDSMKAMYGNMITLKLAKALLWYMISFSTVLVIHILWTYSLLKKYKAYFETQEQQ